MSTVFVAPMGRRHRVMTTAPDKSITHRAVLFNAAAKGRAVVTNALLGEDCRSTVACMRALGATVTVQGTTVTIEGLCDCRDATLDAGNSGTTIRLLCGLLCGRQGKRFTLVGDDSLSRRPRDRVTRPLTQMGAHIETHDGCAPLHVTGAPLRGITYRMPVDSAQVKSAVLLAGLGAEGDTTVIERNPSRDHTERMLTALGADVMQSGNAVRVRRSQLTACDFAVPGDISSAAYPLVLAACGGGTVTVKGVGVNPTRTGILDVLRACGLTLTLDDEKGGVEPSADLTLRGGDLRAFTLGQADMPRLIDEIPVLAVLACFCAGETVIAGAGELKVKESNRIDTTVSLLRAFGADAEATADGMIIRGGKGLTGGCTVQTHGDHRIAMAAAVAAACSQRGAHIVGADCAAVSYPGFFGEVVTV